MTALGGFSVAALVVEPGSLIPSSRPRVTFWGHLHPLHDFIHSVNT